MQIFPVLLGCLYFSKSEISGKLKDKVYIFEFKLNGNGNAEQAIKQIKDKDYIGKYSGSGKKISIIGAAFDEEKRTVKNWLSEELNNTD
ncbi:hypothetical protein DYQ05_03245 [Treponema pedis]|nr:hypothetical protein DYQ05_03245 [Treponema pedis]